MILTGIAVLGAVAAAPKPAAGGWWLVSRLALLVLAVRCWRLAVVFDADQVAVRNLIVTRRIAYDDVQGIELRATSRSLGYRLPHIERREGAAIPTTGMLRGIGTTARSTGSWRRCKPNSPAAGIRVATGDGLFRPRDHTAAGPTWQSLTVTPVTAESADGTTADLVHTRNARIREYRRTGYAT